MCTLFQSICYNQYRETPVYVVILKYRDVRYNLRRGPALFIPSARSTILLIYGANSVDFRGSLIQNKLPNLAKSGRSISEFKNIIKKIENIDSGCMMCRGQHTLRQFPRKSHSLLCFFGSCSHQSLDSLQCPTG